MYGNWTGEPRIIIGMDLATKQAAMRARMTQPRNRRGNLVILSNSKDRAIADAILAYEARLAEQCSKAGKASGRARANAVDRQTA